MAQEHDGAAQERDRECPRAALDDGAIGDPQREQRQHERHGLRTIAIELLLEAHGPKQQDRPE